MTPEELTRLELRASIMQNAMRQANKPLGDQAWLFVFLPYARAGVEMIEAYLQVEAEGC